MQIVNNITVGHKVTTFSTHTYHEYFQFVHFELCEGGICNKVNVEAKLHKDSNGVKRIHEIGVRKIFATDNVQLDYTTMEKIRGILLLDDAIQENLFLVR